MLQNTIYSEEVEIQAFVCIYNIIIVINNNVISKTREYGPNHSNNKLVLLLSGTLD